MGCVSSARLMIEVKKAIEEEIVVGDENMYFWSDFMVSLRWIKQVSKTWKVWLQNTVLNITKLVV